MKIKEAKNLQWSSKYKEGIRADILFDGLGKFIPFHATKNDSELHGREAFELLSSGKYGEISEPECRDHIFKRLKINKLIAEAESKITPLTRAEKLGIATEEEKKKLWEWETYSVYLSRMGDTDEFPSKPDS